MIEEYHRRRLESENWFSHQAKELRRVYGCAVQVEQKLFIDDTRVSSNQNGVEEGCGWQTPMILCHHAKNNRCQVTSSRWHEMVIKATQ